MIEIRTAHENERNDLKQLWQECFFEEEPFLSFWFKNVCNPHTSIAALKNEKIIGALHMKEYTLFSYEKKYKAIYICGFGVLENERKKGIGRKILEYAHEFCKMQNADFVFLLPDIDGYYERFGYTPCSETVIYEFTPQDIKFDCYDGVKKLCDTRNLNEIYIKYASKYDIYLSRSMKECYNEYSLYNGGICGIYDKGYMVYTCTENKIEVFEAAYTNMDTLYKLLGFLKSLANEKTKIVFHAAPNDRMKTVFYGNNIKKSVLRGIMVKPLKNRDVEKIFGFCGGKSFINIF